MLKKDITWIQPDTRKGAIEYTAPKVTFEEILGVATDSGPIGIENWVDIKRIDIRPSKGIAKIQSRSGWELQIDTSSGKVLQTARRRSDLIESIHDGTFFSQEVKYFVFLPVSFILLLMWLTGAYLFALPLGAKLKKHRKLRNLRSQVRNVDKVRNF